MATIINGDGIVTAEGTSTTQGQVRLGEDTDNGTNYVQIQAPASLAANRTVTFPDSDINFSTGLGVAQGGTGATTLTSNNVILGNGTSAVQFVAPGTNGNVLTSNGTTWASTAPAGGGSWTYLSAVTASNSATVDIETTFDSTYSMYAIIISGFVPASSGKLSARLKIAGSYLATAGYRYFCTQLNSGTGGSGGFDSDASPTLQEQIIISDAVGSSAGNSYSATIYVPVPSSTSLWKMIYGQGSTILAAGSISVANFSGAWTQSNATSALTGVRLFFNSGNISSGTARLYGIKNS